MAEDLRPPRGEEEKRDKGGLTDKLSSMDSNEKVDALLSYAKANTIDTIAYVLLVIGIIWLFFDSFYAGILVGVIFGIYFSEELSRLVKDFKGFVAEQGVARSVILGGAALALFISLPGLFIGAAISVALKELFSAGIKKKSG